MTPVDLVPAAIVLLYSFVMGRALLWQFTKLAATNELVGSVAWVTAVVWGWALAILVSLQVGLVWR